MGVDYLDFMFQLEKKRGVYVKEEAVKVMEPRMERVVGKGWFGGERLDIRVGAFFEVVSGQLVELCGTCVAATKGKRKGWFQKGVTAKRRVEGEYMCSICGAVLGAPSKALEWEVFCEVLGSVLNVKAEKIGREQWLMRDLGFG